MIFVSTGGFNNQSAFETATAYISSNIRNIELSGGRFSSKLLNDLQAIREQAVFRVHNYFPPPKLPIVLNLASLNEEVSKHSLAHCKKAMTWAKKLDSTIYSVHAGFLLDPNVKELGKKIHNRTLFDRDQALEKFIANIYKLSHFAESLGVDIFIENNVISYQNYQEFGDNPFLMATPEETKNIMAKVPKNVGLLIDVAHLKVSANSLNFRPENMMEVCYPWIKAFHLSDNEGLADTNHAVTEDSWFWPYLKKGLNYYSLEVYNVTPSFLVKQVELTATKLGL
jgi:sugar phosphate isomerase/epimerase